MSARRITRAQLGGGVRRQGSRSWIAGFLGAGWVEGWGAAGELIGAEVEWAAGGPRPITAVVHAEAYVHDEKARLHERLPDLAKQIGERSGRKEVTLDSYVISATPFDDLRKKYDDGAWDRQRFAEAHILFTDRSAEYDYMKMILAGQLTTACS